MSEKYNLPLAIISSFAPVSGVSNPNYFGLQYYPSYNGRFDYVSFDLSNRFATRLGRVVSFLPHKLLVLIWNNLIAQCAKDFWGSVGSVANVESNSLAIITTYPIELDLRTPLNHQVHYIPLTCDKIKGNADMSQLLNGSHKGIVLVSYGHQWKWSDFVTNEFFAAFEKFPQYKIIWQRNFAEDKNNVPDNVQLVDWIPQTALLGTAKVKIFISHGGPKSLTEGICAGVPMLVCPSMKSLLRFTDVPLNAEIIESLGIGLSMTNRNFDRETLAAMIGQLLVDNTKFRRKISSLRSAWIDKPIRSNEVYKFNLERVRRRRDQMKLLWEKGKTFPFWNFFPMDIILTFLLLPFITLSIIVHSFLYL